MNEKIFRYMKTAAVIMCGVFLAAYEVCLILSGGSLSDEIKFLSAVIIGIVLPGFELYRVFKNKLGFDDSIALPLNFGVFYFCLITAVSSYFGINIVPVYLISVLAILFLGRKHKESVISSFQKYANGKNQKLFLFFVWRFAVFVYAFLCVAKHAHPNKVGQIILTQDFMWTVGNAESIKNSFPPIDIRFSGVTMKYHYLTELVCRGLSMLSGVGCYDVVGLYSQLFFMGFLIVSLWEFGRYFYRDVKKRNLFLVSFFVLSCLSLWKVIPTGASVFSNSLLEALLSNVNSTTTAFSFLSVFRMLMTGLFRDKKSGAVYICAVFIAFIMLTFSKSPIAAIVVLALLCAAAVNLISKDRNKTAVAVSVVLAAVFAAVYFGYLSRGAAKSTGISLTKTLELGYFKNYLNLFKMTNTTIYKVSIPLFIILQTVCIAPFQTVVVLPKALSDIPKIFKLPFETLFTYACIAGGISAFYITYHEAFSQVYFLYTAIYFLNLYSVKLFTFNRLNLRNALCYTLMGMSVFTSVCFYINFGGSGFRQYLYHYDIIDKYPYPYIVKAEDENAGIYLRSTMSDGELFITNRTHTGAGEGLSNVYTCFSGKQSYMEGFKYTVSNMGVSWDDTVKPRVESVGKIFGTYNQTPADAKEIYEICTADNIRYAVVSTQFEFQNEALCEFECVFNEGTVAIYKIY
ncbi:MAG: hypothetical protein PUB11_06790 [Oscillospiraceae bacterium]|nr:hypothetical protein [Oscillospiraceae bacterium]